MVLVGDIQKRLDRNQMEDRLEQQVDQFLNLTSAEFPIAEKALPHRFCEP